jgi:hypothetical protein
VWRTCNRCHCRISSFVRPGAVLPSRPCTVAVHGAQRRARPAAWPPRFAGLPCRLRAPCETGCMPGSIGHRFVTGCCRCVQSGNDRHRRPRPAPQRGSVAPPVGGRGRACPASPGPPRRILWRRCNLARLRSAMQKGYWAGRKTARKRAGKSRHVALCWVPRWHIRNIGADMPSDHNVTKGSDEPPRLLDSEFGRNLVRSPTIERLVEPEFEDRCALLLARHRVARVGMLSIAGRFRWSGHAAFCRHRPTCMAFPNGSPQRDGGRGRPRNGHMRAGG